MTPRWMPQWIGPAAYLVTVAGLTLAAAGVMQIPPSKANAGIEQTSVQSKSETLPKRVRATPDSPDTAPELSPVYPTASYPPSVTNFREEALRKIKSAAADRPKKRRAPNAQMQARNGSSETNGFGYRDGQASRWPDTAW